MRQATRAYPVRTEKMGQQRKGGSIGGVRAEEEAKTDRGFVLVVSLSAAAARNEVEQAHPHRASSGSLTGRCPLVLDGWKACRPIRYVARLEKGLSTQTGHFS